MNTGFFIQTIFMAIGLAQAALPNVFNFEIPQWAEKDLKSVKNAPFSNLVSKMITGFHLSQKSKQPNILDTLMKQRKMVVNGFSWKDCGGFAGEISELSLSPDPLSFPGVITVAAQFEFNQTLDAPLKMDVLFQKKVDGSYVSLPCIGNIGTCTYEDVCAMLEGVTCPDPLVQYGIPCQCPFQKNKYALKPSSFEIDASFIPEGDYHVKGTVSSGGKQAMCLDLYASITY